MATWQKGQSGNRLGRPRGTGAVAGLRAKLAAHLPSVIEAVVEAASKDDIAAARLIFERTIPSLRPEEAPVAVAGGGGSRAEMVAIVIEAIASGEIDVSRGGRLIAALTPAAVEAKLSELERIVQEQKNEQ